jgi:hypothetical protein
MNAIIDTSSLLALVRYYLPFDKKGVLKTLLQSKFVGGELIILDKIFEEAKYLSQGIILKELDFIADKKKHINTKSLIPDKKFFNLLENQFCNKDIVRLRGITEVEFEQEKERYLKSPDANLLLYSLSIKSISPIVVTEETKSANDSKIFKKIPEKCKEAQIDCCSLPILLKDHFKINLGDFDIAT